MRAQFHIVLICALSIAVGVLGTLLFMGQPAAAQSTPGHFGECFSIITNDYAHARDREHLQRAEGRFPVPRDWTVVGGGLAAGGASNVIVCR